MPTEILKSTGPDLVCNLEAQLVRAHALSVLLAAYRSTPDPHHLPEIVRHIERIRLLNDVTIDLLFSVECALSAMAGVDDTPTGC
jgi:hypothetical protein